MTESITLTVNGDEHTVNVDPSTPLLSVLRNELALNGPKYGCGLEQCGSCMVLVGDEAQPSCRLPVSAVGDRPVTTLKGLADGDDLHPVQEAFIEEQAAQCGYCLNGMLITAVALLNKNPNPDREAITESLNRVLCRCGTHARFIRAIQSASEKMDP